MIIREINHARLTARAKRSLDFERSALIPWLLLLSVTLFAALAFPSAAGQVGAQEQLIEEKTQHPVIDLKIYNELPQDKITEDFQRNQSIASLESQQDSTKWAHLALIVSALQLFISIVGTYVIVRTLEKTSTSLRIAETANSIARSMGEAQVRAYVTIGDRSPQFNFGNYPDGAIDVQEFCLSPRIENTGQTPARKLGVAIQVLILEPNTRPEFNIPQEKFKPIELGSGRSIQSGRIWKNGTEFAAMMRNGHVGYIYVYVQYEDIFGKPFCKFICDKFHTNNDYIPLMLTEEQAGREPFLFTNMHTNDYDVVNDPVKAHEAKYGESHLPN